MPPPAARGAPGKKFKQEGVACPFCRPEDGGDHESKSVPPLHLTTREGVRLSVRPDLKSTTTYVLLEQETWFEKELPFLMHFLQPGMTAVDIGANNGVYSLAMARAVGPAGKVFAYEPARDTRQLLEASRLLNAADNLEIFSSALSDRERPGFLRHGHGSELHALGDAGGPGEQVPVTTLDSAAATLNWRSIDLLKIDAEGEEERIIAGGRRLLAEQAPLVMLEIRAGETVNHELHRRVEALGYRCFRVLPGLPVLVPFAADAPIDMFELNLLAAKPETVATLAGRNLLTTEIAPWRRSGDAAAGLELIGRQAYGSAFSFIRKPPTLEADYAAALDAYAVWRAPTESTARRAGALAFAASTLHALCARSPTPARLSTLARVAGEWGDRGPSSVAARRLLEAIQRPGTALNEPFWPASPRFDSLPIVGDQALWFAAAAGDQFESARSHSSCFGGGSPVLKWLCTLPYRSSEHLRRAFLLAAAAGHRPAVPPELARESPDHLNAVLWRTGKVPGATV